MRLVVQALPFPEADRAVLLAAIEQRATVAAKAKQRLLDQTRPPRNREQLGCSSAACVGVINS
jgi:hypothetical protein